VKFFTALFEDVSSRCSVYLTEMGIIPRALLSAAAIPAAAPETANERLSKCPLRLILDQLASD